MSSPIFVDDRAQKKVSDWYDRFAARIKLPFRSRTVPTRLGESHYLVGGPEGAPSVVLFHGALASSAHVLAEAWPLMERFRVYAPDVPGQSPRAPQVRPSLKDSSFGDWFSDVMDGVGVKKANVFGVSWGGFVALKSAVTAPQKVERLALLVPVGLSYGKLFDGIFKAAIPLWRYRRNPSPATLHPFMKAMLTTWDDDWVNYLGDALCCYNLDFRVPANLTKAQAAAYTGPALVLSGEKDIQVSGPRTAARARKVFQGPVEAECLAGVKHCPPTTPEFRRELCGRVGDFFARPLQA